MPVVTGHFPFLPNHRAAAVRHVSPQHILLDPPRGLEGLAPLPGAARGEEAKVRAANQRCWCNVTAAGTIRK